MKMNQNSSMIGGILLYFIIIAMLAAPLLVGRMLMASPAPEPQRIAFSAQ